MQLANRYYKYSKISEVKFRYLLRLFALDLTASDAARLTGLSVRAVSAVYRCLRRRLQTWCPVPAELDGADELDESYFGPRRVRGYMSIDMDRDRMNTRYRAISDVRDPGAAVSTLNSWVVEDGRPGALPA